MHPKMLKVNGENEHLIGHTAVAVNDENVSQVVSTLPEHLILDHILPRLPVKSLIRFKSVSKTWYSVISSSEFAKTQLSFSSASHKFILATAESFKLLSFTYDDELNDLKHPIEMGFTLGSFVPHKDEGFLSARIYRMIQEKQRSLISDFVGSCNGLICLAFHYSGCKQYSFLTVCNPALHQFIEIPNPTSQHYSPWGYWFGYAPSLDDYMIVAPFFSNDDGFSSMHFYVFSLRTQMWKRTHLLDRAHSSFYRLNPKTLVVNDILYWSLPFLNTDKKHEHIIGFDLVNEQLIEIPLMNWLYKYVVAEFMVTDGCLSLHCYSDTMDSDVWILKQQDDWNSWERVISVHLGTMFLFSVISSTKFLVHDLGMVDGSDHFKIIDLSKDTREQSQESAVFAVDDQLAGGAGYVESLIWPVGISKSIMDVDHER